MIKSFFKLTSLTILGLLLALPLMAGAAGVYFTVQGGTGTSSPSGILYGDNGATSHLNTVVLGSNCTFIAGVLNCTNAAGNGVATTSLATAWPITRTLSAGFITFGFNGLATTTPWTAGQLAEVVNGNTVMGVSTTTLSGSGIISVTAGGSVIGSSPITISCATCGTGSVTSVGSGSGLSGGPITTSGTIYAPTIIGTSSSETAANVPFYTTTGAFPALLSGGDTTFTFTSASKKLIFLNGTSTNLSATGSFFVPSATTPSLNAAGAIAITTTAASSSIQAFAGGQYGLYASTSVSFSWSTSTPSIGNTATDTIMIMTGNRGQTFNNIACRSIGATATVAFQAGAATTTFYKTTTTTQSPVTLITNNTTEAFGAILIGIGNYSSNSPTIVTCGLTRSYTY